MKATIKKLSRLAEATHAASKRGTNGQHTVHAVWLSPNGKVAVPTCGSRHFYWDTIHDAYDEHANQLSANSAVMSSWGCKKCQAGIQAGTIQWRKVNNNE